MNSVKEQCPLCGAQPGDWVDDPHENWEKLQTVNQDHLLWVWTHNTNGSVSIRRHMNMTGSHSSEPLRLPYRFEPLSKSQ